jgi:hypothetical protein
MLASVLGPRVLETTPIPRSDQVLFITLAVGIGLLWSRYRREETAETKLRLAALAALVAVVFLSITTTMPWMEDVTGSPVALGHEAAGRALVAHDFQIERWQGAAVALHMGEVTVLALLLPALIWLLVEPRQRAAQAAAAVGASVAGFTVLAVLLYMESIPHRVLGELYWTADLALLATVTIVTATVLIVRQSFALLGDERPLPRAGARYRRR